MASRRISRRALLATGAAAALATLSGGARAGKSVPARRRPNILWIVSEDNNPFIGAYGDRVAHTPVLDSFSASGIRYANVFCNAPVCAPSRFGIITGMYPESCAPAQHMRANGPVPAFLQGFPKYLRDAGYYCTNNSKTDYNAALDVGAMWDESSDQAHWRNRPEGAPFFAVFNIFTTHESQVFRKTEGRARPEDVRVPAYLPDTPEVRSDIASYYNRMEIMDGEVGARLAELETAGLANDTIVFYYSDNGGVLPRSKRYCYDEGLRTALIVRVPTALSDLAPGAPGATVTSPVSYIDLAPTVLTLAGLTPPRYMQGSAFMGRRPAPKQYAFGMRNRMDERYDMMRTVSDGRYRYIRNYSPHRIYAQHEAFEWQMDSYRSWEREHLAGRLNAVQERFWHEKPAEEFYDLSVDRDQIENLIGVSQQRPRIEAMRRALDAHLLAIHDNGFIPEGSPLEGYDASRAAGAYPLKRVMKLAGQAIRREARHVPDFIRLLSDGNEVIRYWAAQGLLMLKSAAAPAGAALASCLQHDASHPVRIVAAETLALLGTPEASLRYLSEVVASDADARLRLQALNALTFIGESARSVLPVIEQAVASAGRDEYIRNAGRYLGLVLNGQYEPASRIYQGLGAREG